MQLQSSSSSFMPSFNLGSNANYLGLVQQNVDSVNASSHGNRSSSIGWISQSSSTGSSENEVSLQELNTVHGWLPSPDTGNGSSQSMHAEPILGTSSVAFGPLPLQSASFEAIPQTLVLNSAYEDNNWNNLLEIGADYVNQPLNLEGNADIFERNIRRRITPGNEHDIPPTPGMSSYAHLGYSSQILQSSYQNWITSSSVSSVSPIIPANGNHALWQVENSQNIPRRTSGQSNLIPRTQRVNSGQSLITSRSFPQYHSSQNGARGIQLYAPPGVPQHIVSRNFQNGLTHGIFPSFTPGCLPSYSAEEYEVRPSNIADRSVMRLTGIGSGGQSGYFIPPSNASVTMRGMLESRPHNIRVVQAPPRPRIFSIRAARRNAVMPPVLPPLQPSVAVQLRASLDLYSIVYQEGMVLHGPIFYESGNVDVLQDMRVDVDNMSYEELLILEEQIGNVSTGLTEEAILGAMRRRKYQSLKLGPPVEEEPCCICRDDYVDREELGKLNCSHDFHVNCIKQWLMQKNTCPICKMTAITI